MLWQHHQLATTRPYLDANHMRGNAKLADLVGALTDMLIWTGGHIPLPIGQLRSHISQQKSDMPAINALQYIR
jgi:hypothetical protein